MTVFRGFVQCKICGENYILRVGIGGERHQLHSFDCKNCELPISIIVNTGSNSGSWLQPEENAIQEEQEAENSTIINLHPSFAFDADEIDNPLLFPYYHLATKYIPISGIQLIKMLKVLKISEVLNSRILRHSFTCQMRIIFGG